MGSLKSKLKEVKSIEDYPHLKNGDEERSDSEINITNKLAFLLSDLNIQRVNKQNHTKNKDWSKYVFVCLHGFPPQENEFEQLNLPGQMLFFRPFAFRMAKQQKDQEQKIYDTFNSIFDNDIKRLQELLESIHPQKRIVLVYHSFGSFILGMYLFHYGTKKLSSLKGMIQISGSPLRYYTGGRILAPFVLSFTFEQLFQQADKVHEFFIKQMKSSGFNLDFKDKYETLTFLRYVFSTNYGELFQTSHHYPNVLKLFIYGRNDTIFETPLINEKVIHYVYKNKQIQNENELVSKFEKMNNSKTKIKNLQQRFIFGIPKGQHSLHTQEKHSEIIRKAVHEYLMIIHEE